MRHEDLRKLAIAVLLGGAAPLAACEVPRMSPESTLPPLVALSGSVALPSDMPAAPISELRLELSRLDGTLLGAGTMLAADRFTVMVPATSLSPGRTLYLVTLFDPARHPWLRGLLGASTSGQLAVATLDPASTAVALAAMAYQRAGGDPTPWDPNKLSGQSAVQAAARVYRYEVSRWTTSATTSPWPTLGPSTLASLVALAQPP